MATAGREKGKIGTFAEAARFGEVIVNCTQGAHSLEALRLLDEKDLNGKILIDVADPLDSSRGMPPILSICNADSLGESIQREFPEARVVKALNTVNCRVMTDPKPVPGDHDLFICETKRPPRKPSPHYCVNLVGSRLWIWATSRTLGRPSN